MNKILISSGNVGTEVANIFVKQGQPLSMLVRKPEGNPELEKQGIAFSIADAAKPETLARAFEGIDTFFFVSPLVENMVELATNLIDAAKKAGVKHIVRSSAMGASVNAPITMGKLHGAIQDLIINSGIAYTFIQPSTFFQNIFGSLSTIKSDNTFYGSSGDGKNALVDLRDIAAVAATTMISDGHYGKSYVVTGGELLSNYDIAIELSRQTGKNIHYTDLTPQQLGKAYINMGMSQWLTNTLLELDKITKEGYVASVSNDVEKVTGKKPITFSAFVEQNMRTFNSLPESII